MRNIMTKELRLSASVLSYLFIIFGLMFFIPGYPILCGVFFVTLGIFQSFQNARERTTSFFPRCSPLQSATLCAENIFLSVLSSCVH